MQISLISLAVSALATTASAHMNMASPPPLKYKGNPHAKTVDSDITAPNTAATFPCKGALSVFDSDEGASVATWAPGSQQSVKIEGGAAHNGGSCQLSLSYDKGATWTVIYSKIGGCPTDPNMSFKLPADAPAGDKVLLGWSWNNHTGNREFYMNCASITIGGGKKRDAIKAKTQGQANKRDVAFSARPKMFVGNLPGKSNMCVKEGNDVIYPEPGPDVDQNTSSGGAPVDCNTGTPITGLGGSGSSGSSSAAGGGGGGASAAGGTGSSAGGGAGSSPATAATTAAPKSSAASYVSLSISSSFALISSFSTTKNPLSTRDERLGAAGSSGATRRMGR
jgi:hypothetical protein